MQRNNNGPTSNNDNGNGGSVLLRRRLITRQAKRERNSIFRNDGLGQTGHVRHKKKSVNCESLTYVADESDVWRAHHAMEHYMHRGEFWNAGKHSMIKMYIMIALTGMLQACVAYATNITSIHFIEVRACVGVNADGRYNI